MRQNVKHFFDTRVSINIYFTCSCVSESQVQYLELSTSSFRARILFKGIIKMYVTVLVKYVRPAPRSPIYQSFASPGID
jgi:hypothetical protein